MHTPSAWFRAVDGGLGHLLEVLFVRECYSLSSEISAKLFGTLLHGRLVFLSHLVIYSIIYVYRYGLMDVYTSSYNPVLLYLWLRESSLSHWEGFLHRGPCSCISTGKVLFSF